MKKFLPILFLMLFSTSVLAMESDPKPVETQQPKKKQVRNPSANVVIDGIAIQSKPGSKIKYSKTVENTAHGRGAAVSTTSDDIAQKFDSSAPETSLPGFYASGGGFSMFSKTSKQAGTSILMVVGALVFVFGLLFAVFTDSLKKGGLICLGGLVLAACGFAFTTYPIITLVISLVVVLGGIGYFVYEEKSNGNLKQVVTRITSAISNTDEEHAEVVKANIKQTDADGLVKKTVSKIKDTNNLS